MKALFLALLLLAAPVSAIGHEDENHICFSTLDSDGNGQVTFEEFATGYGQDSRHLFEKVDADSSSSLDHDEYHHALGGGALSAQ